MAAPSQNVELEAAKFLHKLIQDSKDEPSKLAMKLYVILQHMKTSGKEHSMPFQVISRAMETVINQHGLDLEALKSSRLPPTAGPQTLDSTSGQYAGSSQVVAVPKDSKAGSAQTEIPKFDPFSSGRHPVGPSMAGHEYYQAAGTHKSSQSFDHESPSSLDTRSANSQSQDKQMSQTDGKKTTSKRKRGDPLEPKFDTSQQLDSRNAVIDPRKGRMNMAEPSGPAEYNMVQNSVQMEQFPTLPGNTRSAPRGRQDDQNITENLVDSTSNLMSHAPSSKYPEEMEDFSNQNAPGQQQGGLPVAHENFLSRGGVWNQNKVGLPFDRSQLHRFSPNVVSGNMTAEIASRVSGAFGKVQGLVPATSNSYPAGELSSSGPGQFSGSESQKHGLSHGSIASPDGLSTTLSAGNVLEKDGGSINMLADANKPAQVGRQNIGKSSVSQTASSSGMPFKEQQLKQLRAQCLVFLAFRNGLMPKKQHLEIALGNIFPKEVGNTDGPQKELNDPRGKSQTSYEPGSISEVAMPFGRMDSTPPGSTYTARFQEADSLSKEAATLKVEEGTGPTFDISAIVDERKRILARRKAEAEIQSHGTVEPQAYLPRQPDSATVNPDMMGWSGIGSHNEVARTSVPAAAIQHDLVFERRDIDSQFQSPEQDQEDQSVSTDRLPSPKHTMSEKWIMDQQKRKVLAEQKWALRQQKTKQTIITCFTKLKETVSSSEDISAKTKSVIELKKLQLLELQLRLRSEFLNDYFKPITNNMERLKSYKKHRHGRRIKQLEKYEQKMKEERQKRIRERQKEFFSETEVHKERLDDVFKIRRERWKGFNKYVKEFHKRKERIHREKIDRIQREKINLLKINDVEGYLRMVQDAKSDRVKQLLKATEKYLQKLGSKLRDAKAMGNRFGNDIDEMRTTSAFENDTTVENEDEAKHYAESNEKYYLMAHSIKENINDQPTFLKGGKLREYQMNGLRWLVSLYNNHLNGILADEMGLGKTVQVISLICYLMETKNDRGPFLVVVPSSVLPGWESEISFWAPDIHKIVYAGAPEERRRLFKERIVHQKFNILLTTYEYLMNKHDRPKLSKIHWHYVIIDEGHRIKNASCKLNAELKHYQSSHRLLLTGTPLQNNLEELWALLNFLLPNIFNSSDDFSQWFNKPFEGNGDSAADEALLSEEENLLIINRLHQVLRPFVLRRLKHKVENELPGKIERLVRCEASAYQKLLMTRIEENLGAIGNSKARSVHNSVMELRNICNHPYLSHLHVEEVDSLVPQHYLPPIIRLCGKLEMLDRLLPKLKATDHRILFFSTMTRLLDVMEDYLTYKQYRYLRLDGHTSGGDRGELIEKFNQQGSPFFIFLLSIRAGGVGVNLQAADTVIIFDTDWNPQVDLQAQARAHRIGQKKEVLVLRFETVHSVEEQVRAAAEHKLGVANQSITAGFFDNNTSAEDRREYLESLLRESKKEEAAPVLDDDALNDILARSETEIDVFESIDKQRQEDEMAKWKMLVYGSRTDSSKPLPPLPPRLVSDDDLKEFYEAMKLYDVPKTGIQSNLGSKRKGESLGGLDTQHYGRGKRAREVRSYEEQLTEEQFEKLCQADLPESPKLKEEAVERNMEKDASSGTVSRTEPPAPAPLPLPQPLAVEPAHQSLQQNKDATPPPKRGRGRPRRAAVEKSPSTPVFAAHSGTSKVDVGLQKALGSSLSASPAPTHITTGVSPNLQPNIPSISAIPVESSPPGFPPPVQSKGQAQKAQSGGQAQKAQSGGQAPRRRAKKQEPAPIPAVDGLSGPGLEPNEQSQIKLVNPPDNQAVAISGIVPGVSNIAMANCTNPLPISTGMDCTSAINNPSGAPIGQPALCPTKSVQVKGQGRKAQSGVGTHRRMGKKQTQISVAAQDILVGQDSKLTTQAQDQSADASPNKVISMRGNEENDASSPKKVIQEQAQGANAPAVVTDQDQHSTGHDNLSLGPAVGQIQNADAHEKVSVITEVSPECSSQKAKSGEVCGNQVGALPVIPVSSQTSVELVKNQISTVKTSSSVASAMTDCNPLGDANKPIPSPVLKSALSSQLSPTHASVSSAPQSSPCPAESVQSRRPGRKTTNMAEAPRRRGRRHAIPDASSGQDMKVNSLVSNKSRELLDNKATAGKSNYDSSPHELANVARAHASEVRSPGASVAHDSKRHVTSAIPAYGRTQTADVNDVARVMKEIFSETSSSKTKAGETAGSEGRCTPNVPLPNKALDQLNEKSSDGKSADSIPTHEKAAPVGDVTNKEINKQSVTEADAKELEKNTSVVVNAPVQRADCLKPECKSNTVSENVGSSGQVSDGNSITKTNMNEALVDYCNLESGGSDAKGDSIPEPVLSVATECTVIELVPQDGGDLQQPLVVKSGEDNAVELHNMEVDISGEEIAPLKDTVESASEVPAPEVNGGKQLSAGVEVFHKEVKPLEGPSSETAMQPLEIAVPVSDILQNKSIEQSRTEADANKSEEKSPVTVMTPMVENNSEKEVEPSLKSSPKAAALDVENLGGAALSTEPDVDGVLPVTSNISPGPIHSAMELPAITKNELGEESNLTEGPSSSNVICDTSTNPELTQASSSPPRDSDDKELVQRSEADLVEACNVESNPIEGPSSSNVICDTSTNPELTQASSSPSRDSDDKELVQRSEADLVEACNVESNPIEGPSSSNVICDTSTNPELTQASSSPSRDSDDKELVQRSEADLVEACNVESNPIEGPSLSNVICDTSTNPELTLASSSPSRDSDDKELVQRSEADLVEACNVESNPIEGPSSDTSTNPELTLASSSPSRDSDDKELVQRSEADLVEACNVESNPIEGPSSSQIISDESTKPELSQTSSLQFDNSDDKELVQRSEVDLVEACNVESNPIEGLSSSQIISDESTKPELSQTSSLQFDNSDDKELVQRSEVDLVEACNVESNPTEERPSLSEVIFDESTKPELSQTSSLQFDNSDDKELVQRSEVDLVEACNVESNPTEERPSLSEVIFDESAKTEVAHNDSVRAELQSEDHAEASQQPKVESADVSNIEKATSPQPEDPKIENIGISNMEIDPTETEIHPPQPEVVAEASQKPKIESSDVLNMEIETTEAKVPSPGV